MNSLILRTPGKQLISWSLLYGTTRSILIFECISISDETIIGEQIDVSIIIGVFLISFYIGYLKNSTNCLDFATIIVSHQK